MQNWENFGISILYICKNFLKGSKWYVFAKESNRTICMSEIEKCHSCHLHTKSLMPLSNFFYALCREKLFFCRLKMCLSHGRRKVHERILAINFGSSAMGQMANFPVFIASYLKLNDII